MAAFTENRIIHLPMPGIEVVHVTGDDGDTYESSKIFEIQAVNVTLNTDTDADVNATFSGRTVTVNAAGVSADDFTIEIYGRE